MTPQTEVPGAVKLADTQTHSMAQPVKGFLSSEFVVTVFAVVSMASHAIPIQYAPLVAAVVGVYTAARTLLKVVHAFGWAKALPDLPAIPAALQLPPGSTTTSVTTVPSIK